MRTRNQIKKDIEQRKAKISVLEDEITMLWIESCILCDDFQRYEEKEEEWTVSKRPRRTEKHIIGRIFWMEDFSDEDTGCVVTIQRSRMVRKDGVWLV
jgi:hypothetical protein